MAFRQMIGKPLRQPTYHKDDRYEVNTPSPQGVSSARSASLPGVDSQTTSTSGLDNDDNHNTPRYVWDKRETNNGLTTGDKETVAGVVAQKLFPRAKFVDRDTDLMYDDKEGSICHFVTNACNLQADVDVCTWWKQARKWIPTNISRLRNDKSTAMKWAFLGEYRFHLYCNNPATI